MKKLSKSVAIILATYVVTYAICMSIVMFNDKVYQLTLLFIHKTRCKMRENMSQIKHIIHHRQHWDENA